MSGIIPDEAALTAMRTTHMGENPDAAIKPGAQFPLIGEDGEEEEEE